MAASLTTMLVNLAWGANLSPLPRPALPPHLLQVVDFRQDAPEWTAIHHCQLAVKGDQLVVQTIGDDPYFVGPIMPADIQGPLLLRLKMTSSHGGAAAVYWRTGQTPSFGEPQSARFNVQAGATREYEVVLPAAGTIEQLRFDPVDQPGQTRIERIELCTYVRHPLELVSLRTDETSLRATLENHSSEPRQATILDRTFALPPAAKTALEVPWPGDAVVEGKRLAITSPGLPPLVTPAFVCRPEAQGDWIRAPLGDDVLELARDGSALRWRKGNRTALLIAPLVHDNGEIPRLSVEVAADGATLKGSHLQARLRWRRDLLEIEIDSPTPCEGPVVRPLGELEQGLFAGLEYLGKNEQSSSQLDLETDEHLRFAPHRLHVTMPLMACRTSQAITALTWDDMELQPVYAASNFLDGPAGHRMALRGRKIRAVLRLTDESLEETILWAARRRGLPPLPERPRSPERQRALELAAIDGPLKNENGWGHCAEANWPRAPYADIASALFRLRGEIPRQSDLVPGGAHLRNNAAFFVSGRAEQCRQFLRDEARSIIAEQRPDGSFAYQGPYRRGHFEQTASGFEAQRAALLLEYARLTGNQEATAAGLKSLEHMKRFRTPRGAQTWELSLHTPDILAAAHLVNAYVLGYELTGSREYLAAARRWAASGLPFVYQWDGPPIMRYGTIAVFGATNWRAPNWIGLPVQWCGLVYAAAVLRLAPYDDGLDWRKLAEGILIAAEQMQYPDGPYAGCLPDSFVLASQHRAGPSINPCAMASLRMRLAGELDGLAAAGDDRRRVVGPFPLALREGKALVHAPPDVAFQLLVDGERVVDVPAEKGKAGDVREVALE